MGAATRRLKGNSVLGSFLHQVFANSMMYKVNNASLSQELIRRNLLNKCEYVT